MSAGTTAPAQATAQKVFICYRREETAAHAGRIYDAMVSRFGEDNVFMDVDLAPGVDFVERITEVVSGCLALIVVMGQSWATVEDEDGQRRIDDPGDFVRLEVETGLSRPDVMLVPVLVAKARMPRAEDLPPELRPLARRNALELSDGRWSYDVGRLLTVLDEVLPDAGGAKTSVEAPQPSPPPPERRLALEGALLAGAAAAAGRLVWEAVPDPGEPDVHPVTKVDTESTREIAEHVGFALLQRSAALALAGAAIAVLLAVRLRRGDPFRFGLRGLLVGLLAGVLSGVVWAVPVYLPDEKVAFESRAAIELGAIAIGGGILGSLIGSLWRPRRLAAGLVCGALAGFLFQLLLVVLGGWKNEAPGEVVLSYGLAAATIVGLVLAALIALDRWEEGSRASP